MPKSVKAETRIVAFANQKGGVGKTTTAVTLAACLVARGRQVLLIDLDPQGNASTNLGFGQVPVETDSYGLMLQADRSLQATHTKLAGLRIIPSDMNLAGAEIDLATMPRREWRLADALSRLSESDGFRPEFVFIDCPPSLGLLTLNALAAAHAVLIPLQCEFFALEGLAHLMRTIDTIRRSLNPQLAIEGILLTMFDRRNNLSELVAADARSFFGSAVFDTVIPRNVRVSEAPSHGQPVSIYDPRSPGALAYDRLADELLLKLAKSSKKADANGTP